MSNPFFNWSFDVTPGTTARSVPVEAEFARIGQGFDRVTTYFGRTMLVADGETIGALPAKALRLGKTLGFNATTGDPEMMVVASSAEMDAAIAASITAAAAAATATAAAASVAAANSYMQQLMVVQGVK